MSTTTPTGAREVVVYLVADFIGAYSPAAEVIEAARYPARRSIDHEITEALWTFGGDLGTIMLGPDPILNRRIDWDEAGHRPIGQGDVIVVDGRAYSVKAAGYEPVTFDAQRQVVKV